MKKLWCVSTFQDGDKSVIVNGPCGLRLEIDTDDVDHDVVIPAAKRLLKFLNEIRYDPCLYTFDPKDKK